MMKKKTRTRRTPINSNVERLDHMIDQSLVRKKNFKPFQNYSNERALFEMIDTRIGHMLAKSCEIESKIEAIEKKRSTRKQNIDTYTNNLYKSTVVTSNSKKKVNRSPQSILSVESTETEESIPQLQSASKFLLEENGLNSNNQQSFSRKQKVQQKQEVFKQQRKQKTTQINQKKEEEEENFFQSEQEQDLLFQPKQNQDLLLQSKQNQDLLLQSKQNQDLLLQSKQKQNLSFQPQQNQDLSFQPKQQSSSTKEVTMESLLSLIQTLAKEVHEMHEEQETLRGQIEELQEYIFSNE